MELTKFEIIVLLKHYWKQYYKIGAVAQRICYVEGEGVNGESLALRWFQHFNTGEANTKDLPDSGTPKLWDIENISKFWKEIHNKRTCKLSLKFGAPKDTILHQIKMLGKSYKNCKSIPQEFTPQQAQYRVDMFHQLISNSMDDRFIRRIVTCNEKWVY